jgi:hypothetical protein
MPHDIFAAVHQAVSSEDGFAAIQYALQQTGYSVSPSYRRGLEEWKQKLTQLYPDGHVNILNSPKSTKPIFAEIAGLHWGGHQDVHLALATYTGPDTIFSLKKARIVDDGVHGLVEVDGARRGVILLPAHSFMV